MTLETIGSVVGKLSNLLSEEAGFLSRVPDDITSIQTELMNLRSTLEDADDAIHKKNARARNWVQQLREIVYDAEDIIDKFTGDAVARKKNHGRGLLRPFRSLVSYHTAGTQIQNIKSRISVLSSNRQTFDINSIFEGGGQEASSSSIIRRHPLPHCEELDMDMDMVGMQDDMKTLEDRLIDGYPNRCVVSIVGMGGSGKTTLARKVYHNVKNKFDCDAFIYLSQHHTLRQILKSLIESVKVPESETGKIENGSDLDLQDMLRQYLRGKRYLVVIDDIWSTRVWDALEFALPPSNESRVMLTTRSKVVAAYADSSIPPHEIRLLNDHEGWELFLRKVFPGVDAPFVYFKDLEETGRKIFAKCHGLPLAIVRLGRLLSMKDKKLHPWSRFLDNVTKRVDEGLKELMETLALSYSDLSAQLKPCFLYFGLFHPRIDKISSKKLFRLWIAEGLIEGMSEDGADDYLEQLIGRSMIQVVTRRIDGSIRTCRIHDLLRDFSISEAKEKNFFAIQTDNSTIEGLSSVRRLALHFDTEMNEAINCSIATLRSMLCFSIRAIDLSKLLNSDVKFLRVLDIDGEAMPRKLLKKIGNFVNLRYLSLRGCAIKSLPKSIRKLSKLLILELTCKGTLPKEICMLGQLRRLHAYYYNIDGHPQLLELGNLQTLCLSAGSWIEDCLGGLTNLRKLGIRGDLTPHQQALSESIDKLCSLRSLKLVCENSIPQNMSLAHHSHLSKMYLEGQMEKLIELPQNLTKLTLLKSKLNQDAIDILEKLPKLETLRLLAGSYCSGSISCSSGGFLRLEFLKLDCSNLNELRANDKSMPSLNRVELLNDNNVSAPERVLHLSRWN